MKNIRPCPYCGGEVEVTKLVQRKNEKDPVYRIQCIRCKATVARGQGYPIESMYEMKERIKQYEEVINQQFIKTGNSMWTQKRSERDREYIKSMKFGVEA